MSAASRPSYNEEEGFGRNAGWLRHYYRVFIALTELWPAYESRAGDGLLIEIFETWLELIPQQQTQEIKHVTA